MSDILLDYLSKIHPEIVNNLYFGMLSAVSRMAFDDRVCNRGWTNFVYLWIRHFILAFFIVFVVIGVLSYYSITGRIAVSITLLSGFFAREVLEQCQIIVRLLAKRILKRTPIFPKNLLKKDE